MFFTVIIPTYNMELYIANTLNSLEKQTNQDFEVLIIDDGSSDNTTEIVKRYLKRNQQWKYYKKPNGNWGSVINYVLKHHLVKGQYVTILDADDWYQPNAFAQVFTQLSKDNEIDLLMCDHYRWFSENKKIRTWVRPFRSKYLKKHQAIPPLCNPLGKFFKTEIFLKIPPLVENIAYADIILLTALVNVAQRIYYYNKPLGFYYETRPESSINSLIDNNKQQKQWADFFKAHQVADQLDEKNREAAAHLIAILWAWRKKIRKYHRENALPAIEIKTKKMKMGFLPWYSKIIPIKTYLKISTKKWWTEKNN